MVQTAPIVAAERVEEILGRDRQVYGIKTNTKREINSDFLVLGTGVRPNSEIARDAGLELGYANAIKVDENMRTSSFQATPIFMTVALIV